MIKHDAFNIVDCCSTQDVCQRKPSKSMTSLATSLPVAQCLESASGERKMFSLSHARHANYIEPFFLTFL